MVGLYSLSFADLKLEIQLINDWPNLNRSHGSFWRYQWKKHGTCSETKYDQLQYFNNTLTLKKKFDILDTLAKASITTDTAARYESSKITAAIQQKTGFTPRLWCKKGKLLEISLCVNTGLADMHRPSVLLNYQRNVYQVKVHFPDKDA
ncbi:hypothetical protein SO802_001144 [Lithocarpus litseifolius]|uniref:Uncharacterized protein n=1 Tax=Lithocarpus litseifolius TaxID=425828 RepID=A0AAW2DXI7_9ROSI